MPYPGGKAGPGVYQRLINEIPPHSTYIAACAGHDAIAQHKRPALRTVLIDLDREPLDWWSERIRKAPQQHAGFELHNVCCIEWLRHFFGLYRTYGSAAADTAVSLSRTFVYIDPPYLMTTRTSGRIYKHEMTIAQHRALLDTAKRLPCDVMISGYDSKLYRQELKSWRTFTFEASVRSGERRTEYCWCNFDPPQTLHDARYVGTDKRHRENVRRRIKRLSANLMALTPHERQAVIDQVFELQTNR